MTKRALITGVAGQDGTYLSRLLLENGYDVYGIVGPVPGDFMDWAQREPRLHALHADMTDSASLRAAVVESRPHEVYNFAAVSSVGQSWTHGELVVDVNAAGVVRMLEALRDLAPDAHFCQASSAEIFGKAVSAPQDENTPVRPVSPYGSSKAYAHFMVQNYRDARGMFACNAILYNHESVMRPPTFVTRKITRAAAAIKLGLQSELRLGNLDAKRDWGFAGDYVRALWLMLNAQAPDDYVVASGNANTVRDLARAAFSHVSLNYEQYVVVDPEFFRPLDPDVLMGDAGKARRELGWEPTITFEELIAMMVEADLAELGASGVGGEPR